MIESSPANVSLAFEIRLEEVEVEIDYDIKYRMSADGE